MQILEHPAAGVPPFGQTHPPWLLLASPTCCSHRLTYAQHTSWSPAALSPLWPASDVVAVLDEQAAKSASKRVSDTGARRPDERCIGGVCAGHASGNH